MRKFDIPFYIQPAGSLDCGPTCTQMILDYYGIKRSQEELKTQLTYDEVGTTMYDNAILLLKEGLKTEAITAQPLLFPPDIITTITGKNDVLRIITEKKKEVDDKSILESLENYLTNDGDLVLEIPTIEHIKAAIDDNKPILALLHAGSLGSQEGTFHFVVLSGYDDEKVFINNPWPESKRQAWFPIKDFMYGLYTSTTAAFDNGTLLIVSKS